MLLGIGQVLRLTLAKCHNSNGRQMDATVQYQITPFFFPFTYKRQSC